MKKYTLLTIAMLAVSPLVMHAQKWSMKRGNKMYESKAYAEAIPYFEHVVKRDSTNAEALGKLADSYRLTDNMTAAEKYYRKLANANALSAPNRYAYGKTLMQNGKYSEAETVLSAYTEDARGQLFAGAIRNAGSFYTDSSEFSVNKASFNSKVSDISPIAHNGQVIFSSVKRTNMLVKKEHAWTNKDFYRLFITKGKKNNKARRFIKSRNTRFHNGPAFLTADGKELFLTTNNVVKNKKVTDDQKFVRLRIRHAIHNGRKFGKLEELPFNSNDYSAGHPWLSADGKYLYFSSDMPGGMGGMDLYRSERNGESWGTPENLGTRINTAGNEVFPSMTENGELVFASNGHAGLGGLDIFYARSTGSGWTIPQNIGFPLNTQHDDFGVSFKKGTMTGYFTSNRSGSQNDDIYAFEMRKAFSFPYIVKVIDKETRQPVVNASVSFENGNGITDAQGEYMTKLSMGSVYRFTAAATGYKTAMVPVQPGEDETVVIKLEQDMKLLLNVIVYNNPAEKQPVANREISITDKNGVTNTVSTDASGKIVSYSLQKDQAYTLKPSGSLATASVTTEGLTQSRDFERVLYIDETGSIVVKGTVRDKSAALAPLPGANVELVNAADGKVIAQTTAGQDGNYRFAGVKAEMNYIIRASRSGYLNNTEFLAIEKPKNPSVNSEYNKNIDLDQLVIGKAIKIDNIYFDLGKHNIRKDAGTELDKLVRILNENPDIVIELSSHTDCRGSEKSNFELSDRRAKSSAAYIISKGIDSARITGKGYGEGVLVNGCACEGAVKSTCTEKEHQENRRTEFKVLGFLKDGKVILTR